MDSIDVAERGDEIAIIGMAGRFPGANNVDEFWRNLDEGIESIRAFTPEELAASGVDEAMTAHPSFVNAGAVMPGADTFDASFFGINSREAEIMDPQHRVLLETAWEALENAGHDPERYSGLIGVFAGVGPNTYYQTNLATRPELLQTLGNYAVMLACEREYAVTRISFKLNLTGPSLSVNTACSTSGVAIHIACASLLGGECDMALAGGARIAVPLTAGYIYEQGGIPSPDGHCRAFDADARGTVRGSGVGMVVLKRLPDAIHDGDCIHAVIKGSAINNDGSQKIGFTAPSIQGQAAVIADALAIADVKPDSIGYVEAHGTATSLGDPIEIAGLTQAFRRWTDSKGYCPIGSVKTNIGHLDAGAGVVGVIKTVLTLKQERIPPSLNFNKPNPEIDFANSPFYVNAESTTWPRGVSPRRAGVSSFGLGGANAHIVLEEAPETESSGSSRTHQLLLLSAKSDTALERATDNLAEYLRQHPQSNLPNVAYTLQIGRRAFDHRRMVVCEDVDEAIAALAPVDPKRVRTAVQKTASSDVVFMFSGQGSQYVNMGFGLYESERTFRQCVDQCSEILKPHLSHDLRQVLYPNETNAEEAAYTLQQTSFTQPALFTIEYALAKLWLDWGIQPSAMVGHSIGEYVAACLAGVFSLEDGLAMVAARGHLMQGLPSGSMLAVSLSAQEVQPFLDGTADLAVINAPTLCVVSGQREAVEALENQFSEAGVGCRLLHTSHAFHSHMMEPILETFTARVGQVPLQSPNIPFVSNVTGTWITPDEATDPDYWAQHMRRTVRFSDCLGELLVEPNRVLLEVGPGRTLATLAKQHPSKTRDQVVLSSTRHPKEKGSDAAFLMDTLGQLWLADVQIDWSGFYVGERRHRVPLPTYPFERKRYWIEPATLSYTAVSAASSAPEEREEVAISDQERSQQATDRTYAGAPRDDVEKAVARIWEDLLGVEKVSIYDDFFDVGGSSLMAVRLFSQIHTRFGKNLPLATLFEAPTIEQLADILREGHEKASWSSLVEIQPGDSKLPFFCIHAEEGNVLVYRDLARHLGQSQPFYGLQAQGLSGEKISGLRIEDIAAKYISEIRTVQPRGPYSVGGFCLGGCIAFEMAQQLQADGEEVALLALIQTRHREYRKYLPNTTALHRLVYRFVERIDYETSNLSKLGWKAKSAYMLQRFERAVTISEFKLSRKIDPLLAKFHLTVPHSLPFTIEAVGAVHNEAFWKYEPRSYRGRVVIFRATKQPLGIHTDPTLGWGELIDGKLDLHEIPAYHQTILSEPQVQDLAALLRAHLDMIKQEGG